MDNQGFAVRACALVASEVNQFGGNDSRFARLEERASFPFDFHDQTAFDHMQQFLGAGMHVPGSGCARGKFDDADDGLLDDLALAFEVIAQDLSQLRPRLGLRQHNISDGRNRHCEAG